MYSTRQEREQEPQWSLYRTFTKNAVGAPAYTFTNIHVDVEINILGISRTKEKSLIVEARRWARQLFNQKSSRFNPINPETSCVKIILLYIHI